MSEIERILDNKPSRPPMISTLALRWQSMCPHGSGGGSLEEAGSPKSEGGNSQDQEQTKEVNNKMPFCEIQWSRTRTANRLVTLRYWWPTPITISDQGLNSCHRRNSFSRPRFSFSHDPVQVETHMTTSRHDNIYQLRRNPSPETRLGDVLTTARISHYPRTSRTIYISRNSRGHS